MTSTSVMIQWETAIDIKKNIIYSEKNMKLFFSPIKHQPSLNFICLVILFVVVAVIMYG